MKKGHILLLLIMLVFSCEKEEEAAPQRLTLEETLTSYQWSFKRLILSFESGGAADLTSAYFRPCELDDLFVFGKDKVYKKIDVGIVCDNPGNTTFTIINGAGWSVKDSVFTLEAGFLTQVYKVSEWSSSKMVWQQSQTNFVGEKETFNFQFERK
jgi:hypothetical protein